MKKIFNLIGICFLTVFSFYYTNKLVEISKSKDPIMIEILNEKNNYNIEPVNAYIFDNDIIPGMNGNIINVDKSYIRMKELGDYNDNLYIFIKEIPKISIKNIYDKFIINGNKFKKQISLIFKLNDDSDISKLLFILNENNVPGNFFIDGKFYENNIEELQNLSKNNYLGNLGYNNEYNKNTIKYTNSIINRVVDQENYFCYTETGDLEILKTCSDLKMYTIKSTKIFSNNLYQNIKQNLNNGNFYTIDINKYNINELNPTIKFIKQKGYEIVNLESLISEEY